MNLVDFAKGILCLVISVAFIFAFFSSKNSWAFLIGIWFLIFGIAFFIQSIRK